MKHKIVLVFLGRLIKLPERQNESVVCIIEISFGIE